MNSLKNILLNPFVLSTGSFLFACGRYSFYYGIFIICIDFMISEPHIESKKYVLPSCLEPSKQLIIWYESSVKIFYAAVTNGIYTNLNHLTNQVKTKRNSCNT